MPAIQQDIETLIEKIDEGSRCAKRQDNVSGAMTRALFIQVFARQKDLAQLLLRLSNVKPTGLYPSSVNEESETTPSPTILTLRELSKDGQRVRRPYWKPDEYIIVSASGEVVGGSINTECLCGTYAQLDKCYWERYEEEEKPKTIGLSFLEATKDGQRARRPKWKPGIWVKFFCGELIDQSSSPANLREEHHRANDWEVYETPEPTKTMTGYEAAKLVMEGKTVKQLSRLWIYAQRRNTVFGLTKENLEATDWIEVTDAK